MLFVVGRTLGNIESYCRTQLDNDNNYYWFVRAEVQPYQNQNPAVNAIFSHYEPLLTKGLYIKGNRIFFTLNGVKYYVYGLSHFEQEWDEIESILESLSKVAENVSYLFGELD